MNTVSRPNERTIKVVNPNGVAWAIRYFDDNAAWSRLLGLKHLEDTPANRRAMQLEGWRVEEIV